MYISTLEINNSKFDGIIDMHVIKNTQNLINAQRDLNDKETVPVIFMKILNLDMNYAIPFIIQSIIRINNLNEDEFYKSYLSNETDELTSINNTKNIILYLNNIFDKCMPGSKKSTNSIYDDEEEMLLMDDWDFANMEHTWKTTLRRNESFWSTTPKNFFEQVNIYIERNGIKQELVEEI